jgi:hypothetical protein
MKFYRYKQVQRLTFFGYDDFYRDDPNSFSKKSPLSVTVGVDNDTKLLRFNINRISHTQISQNAKIVIEQVSLPNLGARSGPITVRMNNLNTHSYDSQNNGLSSTLLYTTETTAQQFSNPFPEILYNFSISQNFFQNGYIEFEITYPDIYIDLDNLEGFYITLVVYDIDEQELLLKDTPAVDYKSFGPHVSFQNKK